MKKLFFSAVALVAGLGAVNAQTAVPYVLSHVADTAYAVTMTQEEIAAKYDATWVANAWSMGAALPEGTVMYENDSLTIKAGVENTPVYTSGGKITQITEEWPGYTGYVNMGSSLAQNGWTGEEQILTLSEYKANNQGIVTVTPKVDGTLRFGVYAGDNTRSIGIYRLDETNLENFGWQAMNDSFRNDGENGTTKNAPAYVEAQVKKDSVYALMAGGNKNLCMHQIVFIPSATAEPAVPYILSEVEDNVYAVTMTQEEIAATYDATWVANAWSMGAALPEGTVMYENDELTIKAGVENTPVYTSGGKITNITTDFPTYTGYVNLGSSLAQNNWTGEEQILTLSEYKANNQGIVTVTPKVAGTLKFGVYAGDNTRSIGIYKLDETNLEDYGWVNCNNFRNDGENGTVKNAPAYVEGAVEANRVYALLGGGNKNLCMHQISFVPGTTGINGVAVKNVVNNGAMYNLAGQRVDKSYKGIVIMNGKKYMNK